MKTYYVIFDPKKSYFLGDKDATIDEGFDVYIAIPNYFRFIYKSDYEHRYETMSKRIGE